MTAKLPYLTSPGSLKTALDRIRAAATPERVTTDFVTTMLQMKGGTGAMVTPYLKRIGLVGSDGAPTELYKRFRNPNPAIGGVAAAQAVKHGYKDLGQANEYFYKLSDKDLQALIVQVTGLPADNRVVALSLSTLKVLKSFATFDPPTEVAEVLPQSKNGDAERRQDPQLQPPLQHAGGKLGLNLAYTINLNLPATTDQAVFNAIFKSLKEHLLSPDE